MTRRVAAALALAFALAHLPFLSASLEDIDSANFALGIRDFDVAAHQPHPPGYPVYIALARLTTAATGAVSSLRPESVLDARALAVLSLAGGVVAVWLVALVFASAAPLAGAERTAAPWQRLQPRALATALVAAACPLFWYMAARPMSDMPGLAAELAAQACLALAWWRQQARDGDRRLSPGDMAASGGMIVLGALLAALAIGVRSQAAWLTLPLLALVLVDRVGRGAAGAMLGSAMTFTVGVLAWAVPLLVLTGGPAAYLAALGGQAGDDFAGVPMLYLHPSLRLAAFGLRDTLLVPWDHYWLGGVVVALAAAGALVLLWRERRTAAFVAALAGPYLLFHLLFQEPQVLRYALPLVPPVVFLAMTALEAAGRRVLWVGSVALAAAGLAVAAPTLAAYAAEPSPVRRAVAEMTGRAAVEPPAALGLHFVFRRPLEAEPAPVARQLPAPAGREWLELVKLWRADAAAPVWYLADPIRTDLALVDPRSRQDVHRYRWAVDSLSMLGGMRPSAADWYELSPPGWFAGTGWALTPEIAGVSRAMNAGPSIAPIEAWVRRRPDPVRVLVGGRNLAEAGAPPAEFTLALDGQSVASWTVKPGFFLRVIDLPAGALEGDGPLATLTFASRTMSGDATVPTAIEQFDLQTAGTMMWGYGEGWHEAEYSTARGLWRWTSERAVVRVVDAPEGQDLVLRVRAEAPATSFVRPSSVTVRVGARELTRLAVEGLAEWSVTVPAAELKAAGGEVALETDQVFVPADRDGGGDRRHLGLRVYSVDFAAFHTALR
ncbi:MAG: DUF2723 domain-containing protein [Vicinamibacterales bacterium]